MLLLFYHEKLCGAVIFGWAAHRAGNLGSAVEVDGRVGPGVYEVVVLEMVDQETWLTSRACWVMDAKRPSIGRCGRSLGPSPRYGRVLRVGRAADPADAARQA